MKLDPYVQRATDCLVSRIRRLTHELRGIRGDSPAENIHQARVASRRLLLSLRFYRDIFPPPRLTQWLKSLRGLTRRLGKVRDLDVQREILESWAAASAGGQDFETHAVAAQWAAARQKLTPKLWRAVRKFGRTRTLSRIEDALARLRMADDYGKKHFYRRAIKKLDRCLARVTQDSLPADDTVVLHRLRSDFRKLRYTAEICRPLTPAALDKLIEQAHQFQDVLGRLHDYGVLRERLADVREITDISISTRTYLQQRCDHEHGKLYRTFERLWKRWKIQKHSGLIPEV